MFNNWYTQYIERHAEATTKGVVKGYLEMMVKMRGQMGKQPDGYLYKGVEDLLLQHGRQFQSQPLNAEEMDILRGTLENCSQYKAKQCYYNAQRIAVFSDGNIRYIEGVAFPGLIPCDHAFNSINGKVVDLTWSAVNQNKKPILGVIPDGWEYWGVELDSQEINHYWSKYGMSDSFLQNYRENYPLLKKKYEWPEQKTHV